METNWGLHISKTYLVKKPQSSDQPLIKLRIDFIAKVEFLLLKFVVYCIVLPGQGGGCFLGTLNVG